MKQLNLMATPILSIYYLIGSLRTLEDRKENLLSVGAVERETDAAGVVQVLVFGGADVVVGEELLECLKVWCF